MLEQGFLRVKGQAQITKCYFLWVDAINMQSLSSHYLMRQQAPMVFSPLTFKNPYANMDPNLFFSEMQAAVLR